MAALRLGALLALALTAAGCGGTPLCASSAACAPDLVCGLEGRCAPLDSPLGSRFAGSRWLAARDWGLSSSATRARGDVLAVGGPTRGEVLLAFGPMPGRSSILQALLVLHPHDPLARLARTGELVVEHVEPFRGGLMPPRLAATPLSFAAARRALPSGPARPVRIDLTDAARQAACRGDRTLHVLVRLIEGDAGGARFASPWALGDAVQPRVELLLH